MGAMMNPNQAAATVAEIAGGMMFQAEQIQSVVQAAHSDGQVVVMVMSVEAAQGLLGFQALSRAGRQKFLINASVGAFWARYKPNERPHGAVKRGPIGLATRRIDRTACHQPSSSRDFGRADRVPVSVVTSRPSGAPPIPIGAPAMKQTGVVPDPRRLLPSAPTIASPNPARCATCGNGGRPNQIIIQEVPLRRGQPVTRGKPATTVHQWAAWHHRRRARTSSARRLTSRPRLRRRPQGGARASGGCKTPRRPRRSTHPPWV
jgi:hypothetical protein